MSSWTWSTDNSGIHCVPVLGVLSWTWHHQTLQPLFIACTEAVVGYKWEYQILYYKVISRGFPDERDCLYYVLMGLNSIPDKQRGGREKEREWEHIPTKMIWWLSVTERGNDGKYLYALSVISLFSAYCIFKVMFNSGNSRFPSWPAICLYDIVSNFQ